jgi:hypothetical protein
MLKSNSGGAKKKSAATILTTGDEAEQDGAGEGDATNAAEGEIGGDDDRGALREIVHRLQARSDLPMPSAASTRA